MSKRVIQMGNLGVQGKWHILVGGESVSGRRVHVWGRRSEVRGIERSNVGRARVRFDEECNVGAWGGRCNGSGDVFSLSLESFCSVTT